MKYNLSVLAIFKNEKLILRQWIEHYLREGVDHFYLIDNGSTDNYQPTIQDYLSKISLVKDSRRFPQGTQQYLYCNTFMLTANHETKWLIVCDVDEYIYARNGFQTIPAVLNQLPPKVDKLWIFCKYFGSNGHKAQPKNIIESFTKRSKILINNIGMGKVIVKAKNLAEIQTAGHMALLRENDNYYNCNGNLLEGYDFNDKNCASLNLHMNHYMHMSEEYYRTVKCVRGGGESGKVHKYTMDYFHKNDKNLNQIVDNELKNKVYYHSIKKNNK